MGPQLSKQVEDALYACGKERIFHRTGATPAIRIVTEKLFSDFKEIMCEGCSHDAAGRAAATEFVRRLRDHAKSVEDWAKRIEEKLKATSTPCR